MRRKKIILLIQLLLFFIALTLIYFTYYNKSSKNTVKKLKQTSEQSTTDQRKNSFVDVEYKGLDLNGNRFKIMSETAEFNPDNPNKIFMNQMTGYFYFKDGTILKIKSDYGKYDNKTQDTEFRENIIAEYENDILFSDNIDYLNTEGLIKIYGNIKVNSEKGQVTADSMNLDLKKETLDISMFNNSLIDVTVTK